jgi:hypothetical protein
MVCIDACLADETRTYNSAQIVRKLKDEGLVDLSRGQLREILKKTTAGNAPVKVKKRMEQTEAHLWLTHQHFRLVAGTCRVGCLDGPRSDHVFAATLLLRDESHRRRVAPD